MKTSLVVLKEKDLSNKKRMETCYTEIDHLVLEKSLTNLFRQWIKQSRTNFKQRDAIIEVTNNSLNETYLFVKPGMNFILRVKHFNQMCHYERLIKPFDRSSISFISSFFNDYLNFKPSKLDIYQSLIPVIKNDYLFNGFIEEDVGEFVLESVKNKFRIEIIINKT